MPHQDAVTVRAEIRPDEQPALMEDLARLAGSSVPPEDDFHFAQLDSVHFARLFVLPGADEGAPPSLVYLADVDGSGQEHLRRLATSAGRALDLTFGHCAGYPPHPSPSERLSWLGAHSLSSQAFYVNTVGRGAQQIRDEARLFDGVQGILDRVRDRLDREPDVARAEVRRRVFLDDSLGFARKAPRRPALWWRTREGAHAVLVPLLALLAWPVLVPTLVAWAVILRIHEQRDVPETARPTADAVARLRAAEDFAAHNPFTVVGFLKPGPFRLVTTRAVLFAIDYAARHVFTRGNLAGVKTIHFARWVVIDGGRRVIFASTYDGSLESYMDDFIDKVWWGLNAVFSNGAGYPETRWLFFGGARHENAFKNILRRRQLETQLWYSAYPALTAANINNNAAVRKGFGPKVTEAADDWLARL